MSETLNIQENNIHSKYIFWTTDPTVLYKHQNYLELLPTIKMSRIQQLNALTRFCIYFLLLALIFNKSDLWIQLPIITVVFIIMIYYIFENDEKSKSKETYRQSNYAISNNVPNYNKKDAIVESGFYDSDGKLRMGPYYGINSKYGNNSKTQFPLSDYDEYNRMTCKRPTEENPFMNPSINDYGVDNVPEACNVDDDEIKESITTCYNKNMFKDVSDVFEIENSQRQFFTVPQMNPPDQTEFAKWLYNTDDICKANNSKCLKYEDLRFKRPNMKM